MERRSDQTKRALADALKRLMAQKPVDKISIRELSDLCGIRRQNFYYHFEDVYDLMRWMFQEEAVSLLRRHEGALLWQDGLLQLFEYLDSNRAVCVCALRSVGRSHIRRFFESDIYAVIHTTVEQFGRQLGGPEDTGDYELLTEFYVVALAGIVEVWLLGELNRTPKELIRFADTMLRDHIRGAAVRLGSGGTDIPPASPP